MLSRKLHFFPILDSNEIRVAYQITLSVHICFNCQLVWYQEEIANEMQCYKCPKMARGYLVSSPILGTDISWEEFCKMLIILQETIDASISGILSEGIYYSHKAMQIFFTAVENDNKELIPVWRIFLGADGFTKSVLEMKQWITEGFFLAEHIKFNGWPQEEHSTHSKTATHSASAQENDEDLNITDLIDSVENFLKREK